jgi:hypothetical protein
MYTMLSGQIMNNLAIRFGLPPLCACILPTPRSACPVCRSREPPGCRSIDMGTERGRRWPQNPLHGEGVHVV